MAPLHAYREDDAGLPPSGPARAAILLLALGAPGAARLLKYLTPDEIKLLTKSTSDLAPISREQVDLLVADFHEAFKTGPGLSGPARQMTELLQSALSQEELAAVMGDEDAAFDANPGFDFVMDDIWDAVEKLEGEVLAPMLAREHPQVVAVLLTKISADIASQIVVELDPAFRNDVMRRMLSLKPLAPSVQRLFETHVRQAYLASPDSPDQSGSHAILADIVNRMDKSQSDLLIDALRQTQPKDAETLRNLLFAFEDVVSLPQKSRLVLFDAIGADVVTLALSGADAAVREAVLSALGARSRRMVEAELAQGDERPPAEVAGARRQIATTALRLSGEGKLQLREPDEA